MSNKELIERLNKPCGRTTGHGESCSVGWLCRACADKAKAADAIELADKRIAELEARLKSAEFWQGIYPDGWSAERIENEMHDFRMVLDGLDILYCHITGGMASKPNTDKSVIKSLHDDYVTELCEQAEKDATEEAEHKLSVAREALKTIRWTPQMGELWKIAEEALAQIGGEDARS